MSEPRDSHAPRHIPISLPALRMRLALGVGALCYLGLCAEIWGSGLDLPDPHDFVEFLSLSHESNLPTWAASAMHGISALLLAMIASSRPLEEKGRRLWWLLAAIFTYISIDETVQIHERMNAWFDWGGALYFGWVVPASIFVLVLSISMLGFLKRLPSATRRRMILAACLFVGGAIGIELVLGVWTDSEGSHNLGYALIDWVEESMELSGIALFVYALVAFWHDEGATQIVASLGQSQPERLVRRRLALVLGTWCGVLMLGSILYLGGETTYYRYEDHRGLGPAQSEYRGPDLGDTIKGGERYRYSGPFERFDHAPGPRVLGLFALGAVGIATTAFGLRRR